MKLTSCPREAVCVPRTESTHPTERRDYGHFTSQCCSTTKVRLNANTPTRQRPAQLWMGNAVLDMTCCKNDNVCPQGCTCLSVNNLFTKAKCCTAQGEWSLQDVFLWQEALLAFWLRKKEWGGWANGPRPPLLFSIHMAAKTPGTVTFSRCDPNP